MNDHIHEYDSPTNFFCEHCGIPENKCSHCSEIEPHLCQLEEPPTGPVLPKRYKQIPEFPEYMTTRSGRVRKIENNQRAFFDRITSDGKVLLLMYKDGKPCVRGLDDLVEDAFGPKKEETDGY